MEQTVDILAESPPAAYIATLSGQLSGGVRALRGLDYNGRCGGKAAGLVALCPLPYASSLRRVPRQSKIVHCHTIAPSHPHLLKGIHAI